MRHLTSFAAIALASCAAPPPPPPPGAAVAQELAGYVATGAPQTCVVSRSSDTLRVVDSRTLAYGSGRTLRINRLPGDCPGLHPMTTLIVEASAGQFCRGDRVRTLDPGATIAGPSCNLGNWTTYTRP